MTTKKQLIKLLEKQAKQETELRLTQNRVHQLSHDLGCGDMLVMCSQCGAPMLVEQKMSNMVCKTCAAQFKHSEHEDCYGCSLSMAHCNGCPTKGASAEQ